MKRYKSIIQVLFFAGCITSCKKDFLDVPNNGTLNRQGYVKDLKTLEEFTNGIYTELSAFYFHGIGAAYPDVVADDMMPRATGTQSLLPHYGWSQLADINTSSFESASSTAMNGNWKSAYLVIRACNFVVENADKYQNENPAKADILKGQAYAIRGMAHFKLVNIFAQNFGFTPDASHPGIPYITTSDISAPMSRQTVGEVYTNIISDLNHAIELLPSGISDTRFMNKTAAKALLARTLLFKGDFVNAKIVALEVSGLVPIMSRAMGYPNEMFKYKTAPAQTEIIFQIAPINDQNNSYVSNFVGRYLRGTTNLWFNATNDIADILREDPNDVRSGWVISASGGKWNILKYPTSATGTPALHSTPEADYYQPVVRSSEMFLIVSEASAKSGDDITARTFLDSLRKRANPSIIPLIASGSALIDSVYKERRKELAFEGFRMYDLQRWKIGVHRTDGLFAAIKDLPYPSNKAIAPIPAVDVAQANLKQNPGY